MGKTFCPPRLLFVSTNGHCLLNVFFPLVRPKHNSHFLLLLLDAASRGHARVVSMLLENGAAPDLTDKYGSTPVLFAASRGSAEVTLLLLKHGANVTILNQNGLSPLLAAMARGHYTIASLILEHSRPGPDVNVRHPDEQWTPLLRATEKGLFELATVLITQHKADVSAANDSGWSPLHYATKSGEIDLACLLLDHGADINAIDSMGDSPLNVAKDDSMVSALLKHKEKLEAQNSVAPQSKSEVKQHVDEEEHEDKVGVPHTTNNRQQHCTSTDVLEHDAECPSMTQSQGTDSRVWNNDDVSRPSETKSIEQLLETLISQQQQGQKDLMAALVDKKAGQERLEQQQQFVSLSLFMLLVLLLWKRVTHSSH
jgi:ankyrin repeat protein